MAQRPLRKLFKLGSKATAATVNDNGSHQSKFKGINDIPIEILWKILRQAAILSSITPAHSVKFDFEVILPSLACVCRRWKDVISNRIWRASYFKALTEKDPTCRFKCTAKAVEVDGIVGHVQSLCVLGDELFQIQRHIYGDNLQDISVYGLETFDVTRKLRTYRPPQLKLKRSLRTDFDFGLNSHANIQSCKANNSLYISTQNDMARISPLDGRILVRWPAFPVFVPSSSRSVDDRTGCVAACDLRGRRLLIYTEDGQLTRSIDISQLILQNNWRLSCVAVHDDPNEAADASSSSFLLFQGFYGKTSVTKFRIKTSDKHGGSIEKLETVLCGSPSEFLASDDSGCGALTIAYPLLVSRMHLIAFGPTITVPRPAHRIWLTAPNYTYQFQNGCLDRVRGRLFISHWPDPRSYHAQQARPANDRLTVYNLLREEMEQIAE